MEYGNICFQIEGDLVVTRVTLMFLLNLTMVGVD